ncbi:sensor histidine kinase [Ktedonosporobacter rubrisoli]|uniref:histidine kinase n=1 Tax=Ktedonosporobacter rubrisoli TaxID=2509675 RepID=A0A4P6K0J5_KTERU|nr:sensor histidine kinase [Ktedonosporobacter rubrisoli]QBD81708.1 sensor histidine kinase [Ktedonosporobacter rubrisoli]
MSALFDVEKDNARFFRLSRRVFTMFAILTGLYLAASTSAILLNNPSFMHDWRGIASIVLTILAFLIYGVQFRMSLKMQCPPPLRYAVGLWASLYLVVVLLTLVNSSFVWDFYIVFAISFALFGSIRLLLAVGCIALTLFAFQGLLILPLSGSALVGLTSQGLTLFSVTGFIMLFQHLIEERFERNKLFQQLAQANGELEEAHHQLEQSVVQEQELAILRERTRLAREMHDTIGHALVLISVKLEAAQRLRKRDPERCDHELESTKQIARETMTALRASIADLRSPTLEHGHINLALSRTAREFARRNNLQVTYTFQADIGLLPEAIEETLWKVSQEAFTNIEKHAHASQVQVRISQQNEKLLLQIHDDGIGLPQHCANPNWMEAQDISAQEATMDCKACMNV